MKRKMMDRLIEWKQERSRKPLLLKGVRQVGKTHLLKEFGKLFFPNAIILISKSSLTSLKSLNSTWFPKEF